MLRLIVLSIALSSMSCSRTDTPAKPLAFTPIKSGVVKQDKLKDIDGLSTLNGQPFTGTIFDQHSNGRLSLRRGSLDGKAHGVWVEWYEDGQVRFYGEWNSGLGDGPFLYFWKNGEIRERGTAVMDIWEGVSEGWSEDGEKRHETLYSQGELVHKETFEATKSEAVQ